MKYSKPTDSEGLNKCLALIKKLEPSINDDILLLVGILRILEEYSYVDTDWWGESNILEFLE